jgi:hypothetical protein
MPLDALPEELRGLDIDDILHRTGVDPALVRTVFTAGSLVQGWGNVDSDVDLYVVCRQPAATPFFADLHMTRLAPPGIPVGVLIAVGRECDIELWTDDQVDQVLSKVTSAEQARSTSLLEGFSYFELDFLEKLSHGLPLLGADEFYGLRRRIEDSAWKNIQTCQALALADIYLADALGQLESGDEVSAVLSTKLAFGHAADAACYARGEYGRNPKWRARRIRQAANPVLPFDRYWAVESMAGYDDEDKASWILGTVALCRDISTATPVVGA